MKRLFALLPALALLTACTRDPNVVKRKFVESANKYFQRGKYREASIMYRAALRKDARFGEAYYGEGQSQLKLGDSFLAVVNLRRAIELMPDGALRNDARVKLGDLLVRYLEQVKLDRQILGEAASLSDELIALDPHAFDSLKLKGEVGLLKAQELAGMGLKGDAGQEARGALTALRAADAIRPGQEELGIDLSRSLLASGQEGEAERVLINLLDTRPQAVVAYTNLYRLYASRQRFGDAEGILKLGIEKNPKQYSFLTDLAAFYAFQNRRPEAIGLLERLKSPAAGLPRAYEIAALFHLRLGDPAEAIRQLEEGIRTYPKEKQAYRQLIVEALLAQQKPAQAAALNEAILRESPADVDAHVRKAAFLLDGGDFLNAIPALDEVLRLAPNNSPALYNLGRANMLAGRREQARFYFAEAARWGPDFIPARLALGEVHLQTGEFGKAVSLADEILQIGPGNSAAHLIRGMGLRGLQKYAEARTELQKLVLENPRNGDAWYQIGLLDESAGRLRDSESAFRKSFAANRGDIRGLQAIADHHMARQDAGGLLELFQAEVKQDRSNINLRTAYADAAYLAGRYELALGEYKALLPMVEKEPKKTADMCLRIGEAYRKLGDLPGALPYLKRATQLRSENAASLHSLAVLYDSLGRRSEARDLYEASLKINGQNAFALNNLASYLLDTGGDLDQALTYAQRARQQDPNRLEIADTVAQIYFKKGLVDNAIEIFHDLVRKNPKEWQYRYHLGMALLGKGEKTKAKTELETALASHPPVGDANRMRELVSSFGN
jgi:tetratricopeptide (TPR) repeat protein